MTGEREQLILKFMAIGSDDDEILKEQSGETDVTTYAITAQRLDHQLGVSGFAVGNSRDIDAIRRDNFNTFMLNDQYNIVPNERTLDARPKCGQACSSRNPCTGGCHCIGDLLEDPDPAYYLSNFGGLIYQSKCMDGYFAFLSRRRSLSFVPEGEPDTAFVLIKGPEPSVDKLGPNSTGVDAATLGVTLNRLGDVSAGSAYCPCNCTYISQSCCEDPGRGLVYEKPTLNMGVEDPGKGNCCDSRTGIVKPGPHKENSTVCAI